MKFNIGDKVRFSESALMNGYAQCEMTITKIEGDFITAIDGLSAEFYLLYTDLQPYIAEDTQCDTYNKSEYIQKPTTEEELESATVIEQDTKEETLKEKCCDEKAMTVGLDYEKEYTALLEEYEDLNEELYIAKTAIKMLSELI
jgi:hypothetical protein